MFLQVVRNATNDEFCIRWPSTEQVQNSASLLQNRPNGHLLRGILAVLDGGRMPCVATSDPYIQNVYWEGYKKAHEVTSLFVWDFDKELIHAAINHPGVWHDSKTASVSELYRSLLEDQNPKGFYVIADSDFLEVAVFSRESLSLLIKQTRVISSI